MILTARFGISCADGAWRRNRSTGFGGGAIGSRTDEAACGGEIYFARVQVADLQMMPMTQPEVVSVPPFKVILPL